MLKGKDTKRASMPGPRKKDRKEMEEDRIEMVLKRRGEMEYYSSLRAQLMNSISSSSVGGSRRDSSVTGSPVSSSPVVSPRAEPKEGKAEAAAEASEPLEKLDMDLLVAGEHNKPKRSLSDTGNRGAVTRFARRAKSSRHAHHKGDSSVVPLRAEKDRDFTALPLCVWPPPSLRSRACGPPAGSNPLAFAPPPTTSPGVLFPGQELGIDAPDLPCYASARAFPPADAASASA